MYVYMVTMTKYANYTTYMADNTQLYRAAGIGTASYQRLRQVSKAMDVVNAASLM